MHTHRRTRTIGGLMAVASMATMITGCGGSSSAADVCKDYDKVAGEIANDDSAHTFNGHIFDALDNLAKKVKKFDDQPALKAIGQKMLDMANDDSASIDEVKQMIAPVKAFCATQ